MLLLVVRLFVVVSVLAGFVSGQSSAEQAQAAKERAGSIANQLYGTLKNIAFPAGSTQKPGRIDNRFLLQMPGTVLNYFDYFPGKEYTKFVQVSLVVQSLLIVFYSYLIAIVRFHL